jgi:hypothetical protein
VAYVGKLFLRMLKALILPLIIPSLVSTSQNFFFFVTDAAAEIS